MGRRSWKMSRIIPIQSPAVSQRVDRGAINWDRKPWRNMFPGKKEGPPRWRRQGYRWPHKPRAQETGLALTVCNPHSAGPMHIRVSSVISFLCVCILTPLLSFSFPLFRLCVSSLNAVGYRGLPPLAWCWGEALKFLPNKMISNKKLNYTISPQK